MSVDHKYNILKVYAHYPTVKKIEEAFSKKQYTFLKREQDIINMFNYEERMAEQKLNDPYENEYIDQEYKCKFIFNDGLSIQNYLLPNEYDSIQIENYPEDELTFFEQFNLNHRVILSIKKEESNSIFVKCQNNGLAEEFYNHIMG